MFLKTVGKKVLAFRDTFTVHLDKDLFYQYDVVSAIIDQIFELDEVLIVEPTTVSNGYPVQEHWIVVELETEPIDNQEDADKLAKTIENIEGVTLAYPQMNFPAQPEEIVKHLYGGKRSKL